MALRRKFIGFTGAVQILLTLTMYAVSSSINDLILVASVLSEVNIDIGLNSALGVPLWGGIILLMCGAGNLVEAFGASSRKKSRDYFLPSACGTVMANLFAFLVSGIIIGVFSWAMSGIVTVYIIPFTTIIISASFICILSVMALFVDCCGVCFSPMMQPYSVDPRPVYRA